MSPPTGKGTGDTMETTGQSRVGFEGELSHPAVQHNGYRSVPLPVTATNKVTGDRKDAQRTSNGTVTDC